VLFTISLLLALAAPADSIPQYNIETIAGSDSAGDNSSGTAVPLLQPEGLAIAANGDLYIADAADHRIRKMNSRGTVQTIAGTGRPGFSGDGGPAKSAQLDRPYGLALDSAGNLYVADFGNARVRLIDTKGIITTLAGGDDASPLVSPRNVAAADDGSLYISDFDGQRVYRLGTAGGLDAIAGTGTKGYSGDGGVAALAQLSYPAGLAIGANGALYIADSGNGRVRQVLNGAITTAALAPQVVDVALTRSSALYVAAEDMLGAPDAPIPGSEQFGARALAINPAGNVVFSSANIVQVTDASGSHMTIVGLTGPGAWGDGGPATAARFALPKGCALDAQGNLFVADTGENRIREVNADGVVSTVYGNGDAATLNAPQAVAFAADGSLLIADTGNGRVLKRGVSGDVSTLIDKLNAPSYLFPDPNGDLYIAETAGDRVTMLAAGGSMKFMPVSQPIAVAVDGQSRLYVASAGSNQLLRFDGSGWGTPVGTGWGQPAGLAIDGNGNILVADSARNEILSIAASGTATVIAGTGASGFAGDDGAAAAAQLNSPSDVRIDGQGRIYVADTGNNRIRLLTPITAAGDTTGLLVVSAASFGEGPISPDEIVTLFGAFDPSTVSVRIGETPAALFYAGTTQINALVPHTISAGSPVEVAVLQNGDLAQSTTVDTAAATPALFTLGGGTGQAAALNADGTPNSADRPCPRASTIVLYGTGFGPGTVSVRIGGTPAVVDYAGPAPDHPGLMQVNAEVPGSLAPGVAMVSVSIGTVSSQAGVSITVK